jgi:hypothetical protein
MQLLGNVKSKRMKAKRKRKCYIDKCLAKVI